MGDWLKAIAELVLTIDQHQLWQLAASGAAMVINLSYIAQVRVTMGSRDVSGLSSSQWWGMSAGSSIFVGFYADLHQWLMVVVSSLGLGCCLFMLVLIRLYRVKRA